MEDIDFDNVYSMEQEINEYETDQFNIMYNTDDDDDDDDDNGTIEKSVTLKPIEEQIKSEKLNPLSTTIVNTKKPMTLKYIQDEIEKIPDYLMKRNKVFKQLIYETLTTMSISTSTNNMEDLRKIAISIYKIMVIQTYQLLWAAYLKSGMRQLIIPSKTQRAYSTMLPIWPKEIKLLLQADKHVNENETYFNFINAQLHELDDQLKQNQMKLNIKANHFQGYTLSIQNIIETYIEQHLHCLRMEIEHKIELIQYDYHIQILKLEYLRHKPNTFQKQLMKELCHSKYEQETTEQEVNLLKQQITYYTSTNQSFECLPIAHNSLIDSIQNSQIRQQLFLQYKDVAKQSRAKIFALYMKTAKEQRDEYKNKHEINLKKMWDAYNSTSDNDKISSTMLDLMHQRCMKISEYIKCIYKFKSQSFVSNSKS
ncbi:unnamed protein product [Adineta steineri]|nr:unnamed protein product [Adineta steineri]